ncbi:type 11 methyltransferase [Nitritalea halalkaliphila LW7]|uniref:Type 11 methyltransferase n=1 Tax=Nitritalea halalkaliphila LW7 TaxID=1189621 RepID=I5BWC4_9BACT|nr:class I SAM-dependent methyltransferase [Nitritalea halalkaliphila]EIM73876.1 type 11 methyltransferase [Nitritalea halalkaliphila LW7]
MGIEALNRILGNIDLYLLDQLLKGRFTKEQRILDAGSGEGRNAGYFIRENYALYAVDREPLAIQYLRYHAKTLNPSYDSFRFQVADLREIPFHTHAFDVVLSSAVLHFAQDEEDFLALFEEHMRVLKPGGLFFLRMCVSEELALGMHAAGRTATVENPRTLGDGSWRFVLTPTLLAALKSRYGLAPLEAEKSVAVHGQRLMGSFIWQKNAPTDEKKSLF